MLIVFIVLSTMDLFGQISKGNFIISFDGNYMKTNTESGVMTNRLNSSGQYLSIGSSLGYFFSNRFIIGIALDYNWRKEKRFSKLLINNLMQQEGMYIKSKVILPNIYLGLYFPITNKLYFNTNLKFSYGIINADYKTIYWAVSDSTLTYIRGYSDESKSDFFSAQICPELTYFITPKFGLCLGLGGIGYSLIDWKKENSFWIVNFNPSYWEFGFKVKI